jgi:hypothetical protein
VDRLSSQNPAASKHQSTLPAQSNIKRKGIAKTSVKTVKKYFWYPHKCPTSCFRMLGEMITKLLSLLASSVRHQTSVVRPQKPFEWQSEFLFIPEKRPLLPISSNGFMGNKK